MQEFCKNFQRFFSKIRQRDDRCSSSKIFKFTTENFLIFHIFEKKNCWSFSTSNYLLCEAPLCKTIYHGGPKISEAPPGSPDEGGIWCIFANFSEFLENSCKIFGREAPGKTQTRNIWRARPQPPGPLFRKKKWPTPRRVLDLIILGRLSKLFSKKLRAKRAPLRHLCETLSPRPSRLANKKVLKKSLKKKS